MKVTETMFLISTMKICRILKKVIEMESFRTYCHLSYHTLYKSVLRDMGHCFLLQFTSVLHLNFIICISIYPVLTEQYRKSQRLSFLCQRLTVYLQGETCKIEYIGICLAKMCVGAQIYFHIYRKTRVKSGYIIERHFLLRGVYIEKKNSI